MIDREVLQKLVEYGKIDENDTILEIGAGTGNLTDALLKSGADVYAIEKNREFESILKSRFQNCDNLHLIISDALKIPFPEFNKAISNVPYSISRSITIKLLKHRFDLGVLVYQDEFAKKLVVEAGSKNYRAISVIAQSCASIRLMDKISKEAFLPKPYISSRIVIIEPKRQLDESYLKFVYNLFSRRNKKIFGNKRVFQLSPDEIYDIYVHSVLS